LEHRSLVVSDALVGYLDWPGLAQVFRITRRRVHIRTGAVLEEVTYGLTSLAPDRVGPARLLQIIRQHWHIENRSHWVRDVTYGEDHSQVRTGSIPQAMAALRNTVIGLLRATGEHGIARAHRRYAAHPWAALALIGILREN
jgi:hypothetical protein